MASRAVDTGSGDFPWHGRMTGTAYRFMRVDRDTGNEVAELRMLRGGTVTRNNDVRIFETAEVECLGSLDVGADLVRVYLDGTWRADDGSAASRSIALGTFLPSTPSRSVHRGYSTSTVKMYGRIQELLDDGFARPVTIPKGANAVDEARRVCESMGLEVVADPSDFKVSRVRVYGIGAEQNNSEVGQTKLDMVNDLLSLAGFMSAKSDAMGRILLRRYTEIADRQAVVSMSEGPSCRFESDMEYEEDAFGVANHVVVVYSGEDRSVVGEAWDRDPASRYSTVNVKRTITKGYTFNELPEEREGDKTAQQVADDRAAQYLRQQQSVIQRVTMRHAFAPFTATDAVSISYPSGGISGKFEARVMKLSLKAGCPTETELRRYAR